MLVKINSTGYVIAFFELIKEKNSFQIMHKQVLELREILKLNKELYIFFSDKNINKKDKFKFVDDVFAIYSKDLKNFLKVIIEKNSVSVLDTILKQYLKMSNNQLNILYAKIYTVHPLNILQLTKIRRKLEKMYNKNIELKNEIDESLISGFQIKIGSEIIEQNVNNDLERIKKYILEQEEV